MEWTNLARHSEYVDIKARLKACLPKIDEHESPSMCADPVGGLCRCPVLACSRNGFSDPFTQSLDQHREAFLQALIRKSAFLDLSFHPRAHAGGPSFSGSRARGTTYDMRRAAPRILRCGEDVGSSKLDRAHTFVATIPFMWTRVRVDKLKMGNPLKSSRVSRA